MIRANPRLRRFSIAASMLVLAAGPARADPPPPPPPPAPGPVAMPYPNPEPLPPPTCEHTICLPQPGAAQQGAPAHKHLGGVKYSDFKTSGDAAAMNAPGDAQVIETQSVSWGKLGEAGTVASADPMEGGQIVAAKSKPTVREIPITKVKDVASSNLSAAPATSGEPGKLEYPNVQGAEVAAKTTASFTTLAGKCVKGKHLDKVVITTRSRGYTLHDATVISVEPAEPVDGQAMEKVTLSYDRVEE